MCSNTRRLFWQTALVGAAFLVALGSSSCVVKDIGNTVEQTVKGDYYIRAKKYEAGRESFAREVEENPDSSLARYYYGRFLLQDGQKKEALTQLRKAHDLEPDNVEFLFWTGVAYGAVDNIAEEERKYQQALKQDPKHLQSLIYLGHNMLQKKHYYESLELYNRALAIWPGSPSALYNRALIMRRLGRTPEEQRGWHAYLEIYPSGALARRAAGYLNSLQDYTYRNHTLGSRTITVEKIWFEPFSATLSPASKESLDLVGGIMENLKGEVLQIAVFQKNNKPLAKQKAVAIKKYLLDEFSGISGKRIGISWFGEPQKLTVQKKKRLIDESVIFFTADK